MKLYHASRKLLSSLGTQQAGGRPSDEVPKEELDNAIYFTPDYGYAVAMGSRPDGQTHIDRDGKKIEFEKPELFSPDVDVYIYEIDSETIPRENLIQLEGDVLQWKVINMSIPIVESQVKKIQAQEVMNFYELTNWKKDSDRISEIRIPMK